MTLSFLSIVIPTYNRSSLLPRTLLSLLNQIDQDFEVYIIDDGSTDDTFESVKPFLSSRFHYFYQVNSERAVARNKGISLVSSTYVYFLDSDDILLPFHVSLFKQTARQHGLPLVVASQSTFNSRVNRCYEHIENRKIVLPSKVLLYGNQFSCNFGVRVDSLNHLFVEDRSLVTMEDWIFLFENTYPNLGISLMPEVSVLMSDHKDRSMHQHKSVILARRSAITYLLTHLPLTNNDKNILISSSAIFVATHLRLAGSYSESLRTLFRVNLHVLTLFQLRIVVFIFFRSLLSLFLDRLKSII